MNLKTLQERLCAPLFAVHDAVVLRLALALQWAGECWRDALTRLRARAQASYAVYVTALLLFALPVFLLYVIPAGLWGHFRNAMSELWEDIRSLRFAEVSRGYWERHVRR